jgi:hypothetical protein
VRHSSGGTPGKAANWKKRAKRRKLRKALSVFRTDVVRGFFRVVRSRAPALPPARLTGSPRSRAVGVAIATVALLVALPLLVVRPSAGQGEDDLVVRGVSTPIIASSDTRGGPVLGRALKLPGLGRRPTVPAPAPPAAPKPAPRIKPDRDFSAAEPSQPEAAVATPPPASPPPPPSPPAPEYSPAPPAAPAPAPPVAPAPSPPVAPAPSPPPVFFDDSG